MPLTSPNHTQNAFDYAVVIGRFQPVHHGHVAMLHTALQQAKQLIIVVGSVDLPRSIKNPFSFEERQRLLLAALPKEIHAHIHIVPVADCNNDVAWVALVQSTVYKTIQKHHKQPDDANIALIGHKKDSSSYYLKLFPNWSFCATDNLCGINATDIRDSYFIQPQSNSTLWKNPKILPASTHAFLQQFMQTDAYQKLLFRC